MSDILILGAGVTGLSLARRLLQQGHNARIVEAEPRVGGVIRSLRTSGLVVECAAQALRSRPATLDVIEGLAMRDRMVAASDAAQKRFILWEGKLRAVPASLLDRSYFKKRDLLRFLAEPFIARAPQARAEESVADFFTRRFGAAVAQRLVDPFVAGIYAGDPHQIEMGGAFPEMLEWEQGGSVLFGGMLSGMRTRPPKWAPRAGFTLKGGVQSLVDTLAGAIPADKVHLGLAAERIERQGAGFVVHAGAERFEAERVVITAMPHRAAGLMPELSELSSLPSALVGSVHLAFKSSEAEGPVGFGWLAPTSQRSDVLGVVWPSAVYPEMFPGRTVLRVMLGGAREDISGLTDEQLVLRARRIVSEFEGIKADPVFTHVQRARMPQYNAGHTARVARARAAAPGVDLLGWAYTGLGVEGSLAAAAGWKA